MSFENGVDKTSFWVSYYRKIENCRHDALFNDPFAEMFLNKEIEDFCRDLISEEENEWIYAIRTYIFDSFLSELAINKNIDAVLNVGCGFDMRPYRMKCLEGLKWYEVDLDSIIEFKENIVKEIQNDEKMQPFCAIKRFRLDICENDALKNLLKEISLYSQNILVVTEGIIIYFEEQEVSEFVDTLKKEKSVKFWLTDMVSSKMLKIMQDNMGSILKKYNTQYKFGLVGKDELLEKNNLKVLDSVDMVNKAHQLGRKTPYDKYFFGKSFGYFDGPEFLFEQEYFSAVLLIGI